MATVTTAQLKTTIEAALSTASITGVSVFDYPRIEKRRIFPSIEIKATQPEGNEADIRITKILQRFEITIRNKKRSGGSDDTAYLKTLEDTILPALDTTALGLTTLFVLNKNWQRQGELVNSPVPHLASSLVVLTQDVTSTSGSGKVGALITLTLPGPIVIPLLSKPTEDYGIELDQAKLDSGEHLEDPMDHTSYGTIAVEYESTTALESSIKSLIDARNKISVTLTKDGDASAFDVRLMRTSKTAQYDDIERSVLTMNLTS